METQRPAVLVDGNDGDVDTLIIRFAIDAPHRLRRVADDGIGVLGRETAGVQRLGAKHKFGKLDHDGAADFALKFLACWRWSLRWR